MIRQKIQRKKTRIPVNCHYRVVFQLFSNEYNCIYNYFTTSKNGMYGIQMAINTTVLLEKLDLTVH